MELVIAVTIWLSFTAYMLFPTLNAPPAFERMAIGLCGSELIAAVGWSIGTSRCSPECHPLVGTAESAAGMQIPALTGVMFLLAAGYGLRMARTW